MFFLPKKNMKNHPFPTVKRIRFINFTHDNLPPLGQPTPPSLCILYIYIPNTYIYIYVCVCRCIYIVYTQTHTRHDLLKMPLFHGLIL